MRYFSSCLGSVLFLVVALLASATTASASVSYAFQYSGSFGTTDWQFTVADFLSAAGTTFITSFDSYSSTTLGTLLDVQMTNPFSSTPSIQTDGMGASLGSGVWVGPFDHAGTYSSPNETLTISSTTAGTPEPSSLALVGAGGCLLAFGFRRRRWIFQKQIGS